MLAYRERTTMNVRHGPVLSRATIDFPAFSPYDSDNEPLLRAADMDQDSLISHAPSPSRRSTLQSFGANMYTMPQLVPRYTGDTIVPAIIVDVIPSPKSDTEGDGKKKGLLGRLKSGKKEEKESERGVTKVVMMPRREYLKYFARDLSGRYIGSEPYRRWTEDELEETFKEWKPRKVGKMGKVTYVGTI